MFVCMRGSRAVASPRKMPRRSLGAFISRQMQRFFQRARDLDLSTIYSARVYRQPKRLDEGEGGNSVLN